MNVSMNVSMNYKKHAYIAFLFINTECNSIETKIYPTYKYKGNIREINIKIRIH